MKWGHLVPHAPVVLGNLTCPYCGRSFEAVRATTEHVVGRRFVPRGSLDGRWNLILQACLACNRCKAELEDDISAISMQPDATGHLARADRKLQSEAKRKGAGSQSRVSGRPVAESSDRLEIRASPLPGVAIRFALTAPPQLRADRVYELARFHVSAFFYWITYSEERRTGGFWPGGFFPVLFSYRGDWGSPKQRAFMSAVLAWTPRVMASTADGFFKIAVRRHPEAVCWSWALEWNENVRVIGFCGEEGPVEVMTAGFPAHQASVLPVEDGRLEVRVEAPLSPKDDALFRWE
jgi:hypothetical protein